MATGQTIIENRYGTNASLPSVRNVIVIGPSATSATIGDIQLINSVDDAKSLYGASYLAELTGFIAQWGGRTYAINAASTSTTLSETSLTKVGTGTGTITASGTATCDYTIKVKIADGGKFQFSLDGGLTYSAARPIVNAGTYVLPLTGITITFDTKANFVSGDIYSLTVVGPKVASSDLTAAFTAIKNSEIQFEGAVFYDGYQTTAKLTNTFTATKAAIADLASVQKDIWAVIGLGNNTVETSASILTALAALESNSISVDVGVAKVYSALAREGYTYRTDSVFGYVGRLIKCVLSEDPAQVNRNALDGVVGIKVDEGINPTYQDSKVVTYKKFSGKNGYFVNESNVKGDVGEDIQFIQHRRVMNEAKRVVYAASANFIKLPVRVNSQGQIFEPDRANMESQVIARLTTALKNPINSAGNKGHVSDFEYVIDGTTNLISDPTIYATLSILPLGYPKWITTTISFVASLA